MPGSDVTPSSFGVSSSATSVMMAVAMMILANQTPKAASTPTSAATQAATAAATSAATATASAAASGATLRVAKAGGADVLVDAKGLTLYTFKNDEAAPGKSVCNGACATAWPPLITTGATKVSGSAKAAELGTTKRDDGAMQVTYGGHPVYTFAGDTAAGQTTGQGLDVNGGEWYVMDAAGKKVEKAGS